MVFKSDHLILGTSGRSDLEIEAIKLAKKLGKKTRCVLDDYLNIRERFTRNDSVVLPDEIVVTNYFTHEKIKKIFPELSNDALAGMLGVLQYESNFNPTAYNDTGGGCGAIGIA